MLFKGLKLHITATFLGGLTIAIVLCNMVTVMFWQKAMVRSEIENSRTLLKMAVRQESGGNGVVGNPQARGSTGDCENSSGGCLSTVFFDGEKLLDNSYPELAAVMSASARESIQSQSGVVDAQGQYLGGLFFCQKVRDPGRT